MTRKRILSHLLQQCLVRNVEDPCPLPHFISCVPQKAHPSPVVHLDESGHYVDGDVTSPLFDLPSFYNKIDDDLMGKLPHDLVLSKLADVRANDLPFSEYFVRMNDGLDEKSPDIIFLDESYKTGEHFSIIEVGTSRGNLENYYHDKFLTYFDAFKSRSDGRFFIIVVGPQGVYTNIPMRLDEAMTLVDVYRYGCQVQSEAEKLGWNRTINADLLERVKKFASSLKSMPFYQSRNANLNINNEVLDLWDEEIVFQDMKSNGFSPQMASSLFGKEPDSFDDYIKLINDGATRLADDRKPVFYFPAVIMRDEFADHRGPNEKYFFRGLSEVTPENNLQFLWNIAYNEFVTCTEDSWISDKELVDRPLGYEELKSITQANRQSIKTKDRYRLQLDPETRSHIESRGVGGKAASWRDPKVKEGGFGFDCDTSDINLFINNETMLDLIHPSVEYNRLKDLIDVDDDVSKFFLAFSSSKLGLLTSFISAIASEINVNTTKGVEKDEWLILQSRVYRCLILLKNAGGKHYFYSICIPKSSVLEILDGPFIQLYEYGDYYITEIYSTRPGDLSMHLGMHSKMMATYSALLEISGQDFLSSEPHRKMKWLPELLAIFLISMENKEHTSSTIMNFRYAYNECVDSDRILRNNPFKIVEKFPVVIRSRLLMFFLSNFNEVFKNVETRIDIDLIKTERTKVNRSDDDDLVDPSQDKMSGFKSFVSLNEVEDFSQVLNLMYFGVFHEKSKGESIHGYLKIFNKVVDEEIKMRQTRPELLGTKRISEPLNPHFLRSHEFDYRHNYEIGKNLRKTLDLADPNLIDNLYIKISNVSFDYFSSLKASADCSQFRSDVENLYGSHKNKKRPKCLSETLRYMSDPRFTSANPFTQIDKVTETVLEMGGIVANLFKKQQLTGTREIFVLVMASRILINYLETITRSLCELLPNEYLTKGDQKLEDISAHFAKLKRYSKTSARVTISDSLDMTTWCQRFTMPMFGSLLSGIFSNSEENDFRRSMMSILNLVTDKKLELPTDLLDLFMKHPDIESQSSAGLNELKQQFLGRSPNSDLIQHMGVMLKNNSNMMQGILHYTSSLLHSAHLFWVKEKISGIIYKEITKRYPIEPNKIKVMTLTMCSSDDAGRITSVLIDDVKMTPDMQTMLKKILSITSIYLVTSYGLAGIKVSMPKSTLGVFNWVYEFNSVWYFRNTIMLPMIKWSRACTDYKISSNATERMLLDHNSMKDLIKSGCSVFTTRVHNMACLINHYDCVGLYSLTLPMWKEFTSTISQLKHPSCWYYLMTHDKVGPILGYDFTLYYHLSNNECARKTESIIRTTLSPESQISSDSSLNVTLAFGNLKKYVAFLNSSNVRSRSELCDEVIKSPEHFFGVGVKSKEDCKTMIEMNAHKPKVHTSFIFQSASNQHRASTYIWSSPCIRARRSGKEPMYYSLRTLSVDLLDSIKMIDDNYDLSLHFNNSSTYDDVIEMCREFSYTKTFSCKKRQFPVSCTLPVTDAVLQIDLKKLLKRIWFKEDNGKSERMCELVFDRYKRMLPWLDDNLESSFAKFKTSYPDMDIIHFLDTISSYQNTPKTVSIMHRGPLKRGFMPSLRSMIRFGYSSKHYLCSLGSDVPKKKESSFDSLLNLFISGPRIPAYEGFLLNKILETYSTMDTDEPTVLGVISKTYNMLGKRISGVINEANSTEIYDNIRRLRMGVLGWWIRQQRLVGEQWRGIGTYAIMIDELIITIEIEDDVLVSLRCNMPNKIHNQILVLNRVIVHVLKLKRVNLTNDSGLKISCTKTSSGFSLGKMAPMRSKNLLVQALTRDVQPPRKIYATITVGGDKLQLKLSGDNDLQRSYNCVSLSYRPSSSVELETLDISPITMIRNKDIRYVEPLDMRDEIMESELIHAWMNREPADIRLFPKLSSNCTKYPDEQLSLWLRQTFLCKLSKCAKLPGPLYCDTHLVVKCKEEREEELGIEDSDDERFFDDMLLMDDDQEINAGAYIDELGDSESGWEDFDYDEDLEKLAESSIKTFSEISRFTMKRFRKIELSDGGEFWDMIIAEIEQKILRHSIARMTWIDGLPGAVFRFFSYCGFKQKPEVVVPDDWQ